MNQADMQAVYQKMMLADRFSSMGLMPPMQPGDRNWAPTRAMRTSNLFGSDENHLLVPRCHKPEILLLMADRWQRADHAHSIWAQQAKTCVDYVEGRQWTADEMARAEAEDRPILTHNKIGALVRLVLGYHRNNRLQNKFIPTDDGNSTQNTAELLSKIDKRVSANMKEPYVDTEVFMDGQITGRGFYDYRLSFDFNDFGDAMCRASDPFTVRIDPDADTYAPHDWNYIMEARWWSLDEVEFTFGPMAAALLEPFVNSSAYTGGIANSIVEMAEEITPWRTFGGGIQQLGNGYMPMDAYIGNSYDPLRKTIRVIDCQHYIRVMQRCVIDLETGDRKPIPDHFTSQQIEKMMMWCAEQYAIKGKPCPLRVSWRPMRRVRWTTVVGDLVVYDDWSPYKTFTKIPYFPWFRRGMTKGMVEDLIDPQRGINRIRSAWVDNVERTAHSGWMWHKNSLSEDEKIKIERYGAAAGINIEWQGNPQQKPEKIQPGTPPVALERLEQQETADLKEISGINDSALGQLDRVQSGRALEARQRQSILGIEPSMDNYKRTKELCGEKKLEIYQDHYTEPRLFNLVGQDGKTEQMKINLRGELGAIVNNINLGKYKVDVSETPLTASFLNAQMEEMISMAEKGLLPIPLIQDIAIDLSTLPQKELLKMRLNAYMKAQGMVTADELVAMIQAGVMPQAGSVPPPGPAGEQTGGEKKPDPNSEGGTAGGANSGAAQPPAGAQGQPAPALAAPQATMY
jgi:hypothetical protein